LPSGIGRSFALGLLLSRSTIRSAKHAGITIDLWPSRITASTASASRANYHEHTASAAAPDRTRTINCWNPVG
jgi:hypothetical protein